LLHKLGYRETHGHFHHPGRQVIFVGDYVDRGPHIPEVLSIVRRMVDAGDAIALMGNHEFNALCFHERDLKYGGHLRRHSIKHILQHADTLAQFKGKQEEWDEWIEWFRSLPMFYENEYLRAVHACWDDDQIRLVAAALEQYKGVTPEFLSLASDHQSPLYFAIEDILKGKELPMPDGMTFLDKDGNTRSLMRIKWWENFATATYKSISVIPMDNLPDLPLPLANQQISTPAHQHINKPTFFGHYWLKGNPALNQHNICCLDYSVAKGGKLVAYRFEGEAVLEEKNFVFLEN
jgi:hypothetical protein